MSASTWKVRARKKMPSPETSQAISTAPSPADLRHVLRQVEHAAPDHRADDEQGQRDDAELVGAAFAPAWNRLDAPDFGVAPATGSGGCHESQSFVMHRTDSDRR